jgi:diketogulonate reductase-like aldo/keto reductase
MIWAISPKATTAIQPIINRVMVSGKLSRQEHIQLTSAILAVQMSDDERRQINRVFDYLQTGRVHLVD